MIDRRDCSRAVPSSFPKSAMGRRIAGVPVLCGCCNQFVSVRREREHRKRTLSAPYTVQAPVSLQGKRDLFRSQFDRHSTAVIQIDTNSGVLPLMEDEGLGQGAITNELNYTSDPAFGPVSQFHDHPAALHCIAPPETAEPEYENEETSLRSEDSLAEDSEEELFDWDCFAASCDSVSGHHSQTAYNEATETELWRLGTMSSILVQSSE
ncbi:unnamed protein product [Mycena citricolor]|uniref:Uncharacterized protein n=1 Tax=Mycena citricolor TaxID=2018698 RepID=A0AAD2JZR0_9AGAR|nr:unnamed protein product [Mycena citricolor]